MTGVQTCALPICVTPSFDSKSLIDIPAAIEMKVFDLSSSGVKLVESSESTVPTTAGLTAIMTMSDDLTTSTLLVVKGHTLSVIMLVLEAMMLSALTSDDLTIPARHARLHRQGLDSNRESHIFKLL